MAQSKYASAQQMEENIDNATPVIGANGNWQAWSVTTHKYEDTGKPARGATGDVTPAVTALAQRAETAAGTATQRATQAATSANAAAEEGTKAANFSMAAGNSATAASNSQAAADTAKTAAQKSAAASTTEANRAKAEADRATAIVGFDGSYGVLTGKPKINNVELLGNKTLADIGAAAQTEVAANTQARHTHGNKGVLDGITAALITGWNGAVDHITDAVKHITAAKRSLWNTVSSKADKAEVSEQLSHKAPLESPALTGAATLNGKGIATATPPQEVPLPVISGYVTKGKAVCFKTQEQVGVVNFNIEASAPIQGSQVHVATLPSNICPSDTVIFAVVGSSGATKQAGFGIISTNGMLAFNFSQGVTAVAGSATFKVG